MNKRSVGNFGEQLALEFFKKNDFEIVCRNYYSPHGEVDLVLVKDSIFYFVEVKYRRSIKYGSPRAAMTAQKVNRFKKTAIHYITNNFLKYNLYKLSFLGITDLGNKTDYDFIENILT